MPNSAFTDNRTEAARALVEHLRSNPDLAAADPLALAEKFGLPPEFVRRALGRFRNQARPISHAPHPIATRADGLVAFLDRAVEKAASNPIRFEVISLVAAMVLIAAISIIMPRDYHNPFSLRAGLNVVVMLLTVAAQMVVFYRRRMARYALYGGLVFGVGTAIPVMILIWSGLRAGVVRASGTDLQQGAIVFAVGLSMMLVGAIYGGFAALLSVVGGWVQLRKADLEWERLSRQELLERYFELQRRLERSVNAPTEKKAYERWPLYHLVRTHPIFSATGLGVISGLTEVGLSAAFHIRPIGSAGSDAFELINVVAALVFYCLFTIIGFLSGRATKGALAGAGFVVGTMVGTMLPVAGYAPSYAFSADHIFSESLVLAFVVFIGALTGVGATIQQRAARDGRLEKNDGATLIAEMLEIQWRLEEDATNVTVLVVDAAKSTAMKVGADPLDVEYSFREYQSWIAECCAGFGGRMHSVAGDGAVVAFPNGQSAIAAARRIQTDIGRFNAAANRLPKPFRLRLGLHAGRVAGDLNDVQFTEVIDIAAHVEDIAPVGGIAATQAVVNQLGEDGFLPLAREIDGQAVFIALVPTEL